jgi:histidine phosphotransferase ChpT
MLLIAGQAIPRGGILTVAPEGSGETIGFRVSATGLNARVPQAIPHLLAGGTADEASIDAHAVQPFYTGLLAKDCGLAVTMAVEGDAIVVAAR